VLTALANFASLPLIWQLFDALQAWLPHAAQYGVDAVQLQSDLRVGRITGMVSAALTALVFACTTRPSWRNRLITTPNAFCTEAFVPVTER